MPQSTSDPNAPVKQTAGAPTTGAIPAPTSSTPTDYTPDPAPGDALNQLANNQRTQAAKLDEIHDHLRGTDYNPQFADIVQRLQRLEDLYNQPRR